MEFRMLGPVRVLHGGHGFPVGEPRQQAVLAALLIDAGRPVSVDTLVDRVWGDAPPAQVRRSLQAHIAKVRRAVRAATGVQPLHRTTGGYVLTVDALSVDALRFRDLVTRSRADTVDGRRRATLLRTALGLWHGQPLAEVAGAWAERVRRALERERVDATVSWARAETALGDAETVLGPLTALAEEYPTLETAAATLVQALHAAGRPAAALDHYDTVRRRLREEFGTDPGPRLQVAYQAVLRHDTGRIPAARSPEQLPADVPAFVGRAGELAELDRGLTGSAPLCVTGTAGVGKTTLAVHWAHRVRDRFPDGRLFVDLCGFHPDRSPAQPQDVLRELLGALDVPPGRMPAGTAARSAQFRTLLAGRRVLVVLDNAVDAEQVRPLLPGSTGSLAVVTSRNRLGGLLAAGARPVRVALMPSTDAATLLGKRLGVHRIAGEPAAAGRLIERCGGLPIALVVAAARAAANPGFSLASVAAELGDVHDPLDGLDGGDPATDVRAVLSWSYHRLGPADARMFRLLGLAPGAEFTPTVAAALAGVPHADARSALAALGRAHLIDEYRPGRYSMHDLLRRYARELTPGP